MVSSQGQSSQVAMYRHVTVTDFHLPHDMSSCMVAPLYEHRCSHVSPCTPSKVGVLRVGQKAHHGGPNGSRASFDQVLGGSPPQTKGSGPHEAQEYELTSLLIHRIRVFLSKNKIDPPN